MSEPEIYEAEFTFNGYIVPLELVIQRLCFGWILRCDTNVIMFELYLN